MGSVDAVVTLHCWVYHLYGSRSCPPRLMDGGDKESWIGDLATRAHRLLTLLPAGTSGLHYFPDTTCGPSTTTRHYSPLSALPRLTTLAVICSLFGKGKIGALTTSSHPTRLGEAIPRIKPRPCPATGDSALSSGLCPAVQLWLHLFSPDNAADETSRKVMKVDVPLTFRPQTLGSV